MAPNLLANCSFLQVLEQTFLQALGKIRRVYTTNLVSVHSIREQSVRTHILGARHGQWVWGVGQTEELSLPAVGAGPVLPLEEGSLASLRPELVQGGRRGYILLNVQEIGFVFF